ncbi:MAG: protein-L-isoaspartate(D-aspartate) O-methyltransferase [Endomicrobiales bacterium]|nr:protein-L-isoaspartate(D-aspartate) O-methyltransferase [Endomicrobiales bacterium]
MIKTQLIPRGISDKRVLDAIRKVKRHLFVTKAFQDTAYFDHPLPIGEGQTISQPYMVAWMTELLNLKGTEKVLEIGTGSGYQTAVLSELAKHVFTIERIETLSINAQKILNDLNYKNISFKIGDGTEGWQNEAPFDRILITAGSPVVPAPLLKQLSEGGKLLIPLGERFAQNLTMVEKKDGKMTTKELGACVFVPLIGRHAV